MTGKRSRLGTARRDPGVRPGPWTVQLDRPDCFRATDFGGKDNALTIALDADSAALRAPLEIVTPAETPARSAVEIILATLDEAKAEDITAIDITGKTSLADHMVVASGRSHRHVGAIADQVLKDLKENGYGNARVEGLPQCDWVLIDAGDVIVHVFRPEVRSFYNIEKMWSSDPIQPVRPRG